MIRHDIAYLEGCIISGHKGASSAGVEQDFGAFAVSEWRRSRELAQSEDLGRALGVERGLINDSGGDFSLP